MLKKGVFEEETINVRIQWKLSEMLSEHIYNLGDIK